MIKYAWKSTHLQVHFIERVYEEKNQTCANIDKVADWATPIRDYLESGELPQDKIDAKRIIRLAPSYKIIDGTLYKRGFSTSFLICIGHPETTTTLREVYEGYIVCHKEARSIVRTKSKPRILLTRNEPRGDGIGIEV